MSLSTTHNFECRCRPGDCAWSLSSPVVYSFNNALGIDTVPKPKELLEEEAEIQQQKAAKAALAEFKPTRRDFQIVWDTVRRSGKISLSGLMSVCPAYSREQSAAIADSMPDLLCMGMGNRRVWWPR